MYSTMSNLESSLDTKNYYIVCLLSTIASFVVVLVSVMILVLVCRTRPLLSTVRHLLMCNTCIASILYSVIQTINYIYLIFLQWERSDITCRWRAYFGYLGICAVVYSYLIQTISRIFISLLSSKYRWLTTFKTHYILLTIKWLVIIIIPLSTVITNDISFHPNLLCWVPMEHLLHIIYIFLACYIVPTILALLIYAFIYYRLKKMIKYGRAIPSTSNNKKRDLEVLRNIIVLLCIYLLGGLPSVLFFITNIQTIYLISIVFISLAVAVEKICMCILDRDIRQIIGKLLISRNRVTPVDQLPLEKIELQAPHGVQQERF